MYNVSPILKKCVYVWLSIVIFADKLKGYIFRETTQMAILFLDDLTCYDFGFVSWLVHKFVTIKYKINTDSVILTILF